MNETKRTVDNSVSNFLFLMFGVILVLGAVSDNAPNSLPLFLIGFFIAAIATRKPE